MEEEEAVEMMYKTPEKTKASVREDCERWKEVFSAAVDFEVQRDVLSDDDEVSVWKNGSLQPTLNIEDYVGRLVGVLRLDWEVLVIAYVLIRRFCESPSSHGCCLTMRSIHRVLLVAIVVADKWHYDGCRAMRRYADAGGVPPIEAARMERHFLKSIHYDVYVSGAAYERASKIMLECWAFSSAPVALLQLPVLSVPCDNVEQRDALSGMTTRTEEYSTEVEQRQQAS